MGTCMTNKVKRQRLSKEEWLKAGLKMLAEHGVDKLTIGSLSRTVGVAKTSFYWHFKARTALHAHMLEYWVAEFNNVVTDNPQLLELEPRQRLQAIIDASPKHDVNGIMTFYLDNSTNRAAD